MGTQPRRRILVALEPTVLEGAFATLLRDGERSDVVQFHQAGVDKLAQHYDAAIVTLGFEHEVESDVLITLPDTEAGGREASVTINGVTRPLSVDTNAKVIDLLEDQFSPEILGAGADRLRLDRRTTRER